MDKQSYKEMLAEEMSKTSDLEREISRLQILVAKYSDRQREINKMVYDNPNDMSLGKKIRNMIWQDNE